jgi:uroporphyrinogen decarboxylase
LARYKNDLMQRALAGETLNRPPVWLMRQAGRTDPEYNKLKEDVKLTLEEMFSNPEVSAKVSLLPRKLGIDAIIFFQDILTITTPMGAPFLFRPGPVLDKPIRSLEDVKALKVFDVGKKLDFVPKTLKLVQKELDGEMPVLGFAGAPLTLAVFLMLGQSFGPDSSLFKKAMVDDPKLVLALVDRLTDVTIEYLLMQAEAGVLAVQLFESAAHLLTVEQYRKFALPSQQKIFAALKGKVPTICFAHNWNDVKTLGEAGADIISLPSTVTIKDARKILGAKQIVQGNVSNHLLETGSKADIRKAVKDCIVSGERRGHVFNLDHGLIRSTPFENVKYVVDAVHEVCAELGSARS